MHLRCKIFSLKIWVCKIFDKFHVCNIQVWIREMDLVKCRNRWTCCVILGGSVRGKDVFEQSKLNKKLNLYIILLPIDGVNFAIWVEMKQVIYYFYRTRVRSLGMLVSNWLTHSLTHSLLFSKLDWCDPGVWRCQLKTCYCCSCWCWGSCWQQFVTDLGADVWS